MRLPRENGRLLKRNKVSFVYGHNVSNDWTGKYNKSLEQEKCQNYLNISRTMHIGAGHSASQAKVIFLGDTGVGKSSIISAFNNETFDSYSEPTLGAAYLTKFYSLPTGQNIKFHIWDTAGQQRYRSISSLYYKTARIAICVFDITSMHSFKVMQTWVKELKAYGPANAVIAVVGNKTDLFEDEEVSYKTALEYGNSIGAIVHFVSAKDKKNIESLFNAVGLAAMKDLGVIEGRGRRLSVQVMLENKSLFRRYLGNTFCC